MHNRRGFVALVLCVAFAGAVGQPYPPQQEGPRLSVVEELLKFPAPPPGPGLPGESGGGLPALSRASLIMPPGLEDSLEALGRYWAERGNQDDLPLAPQVRERLLEAAEAFPELLPRLLGKIPDTVASHERVKGILDAHVDSQELSKEWRIHITRYLMLGSKYFRAELIAQARAAHDEEGYVAGEKELRALARLDWPQAEPLLQTQAEGKSPRVAALAKALLYRHSEQENAQKKAREYRDQLKAVVADRRAPGRARDIACTALLQGDWEGRDDWYLSLFRDATLRELKDGYYLLGPLDLPIREDPDKWIPVVSRLVGSETRAVHDAAVSLLILFQLREARRDALLPLLPWLFDPKWSSARDRLRLIQSMNELEMPESIPGLIAVLDQSNAYDRSYAAESLAHYRDPRAIPALKRALEQEKEWGHRRRIIQALVACGGLSADEQEAAIEGFGLQVETERGREELGKYVYDLGEESNLPAQVAIGLYLSQSEIVDEGVIGRLLVRAEALKSLHPSLAVLILGIVDRWPSRTADLNFVARVESGAASGDAVRSALLKRDSLRKTAVQELNRVASGHGASAGIAVILLGDNSRVNEVLSGTDGDAQAALLASARLVRERLPVPAVAHLLESRNQTLAAAAEAYLESEDSAAARELVLSRHPKQALILGARQEFDPGHNTYAAFDRMETHLRDEVLKPDGPSEVFALLSAGYWGDAGQIMVYVSPTGVEIVSSSGDKLSSTRPLSDKELRGLRSFIEENRVEEFGPLAIAVMDGMQYEYVHVAQSGGRRVFMNNPGTGSTGGSIYDRLRVYFERLVEQSSAASRKTATQ